MSKSESTDQRPLCRYPYLCGEAFCDCALTPDDIDLMDENVRQISVALLRDDLQ